MRRLIPFVGSLLTVCAFALPVSTALAHPGHGSTDPHSALHLAEPLHVLAWLVPLAIAALVGFKLLRRDS
jgi:hypothetical protein